ncbi:tRNA lysidine(34) synthetase TilS [Bacillus spongiae]|uniref:tRNA(Ile)-lysidine synthase n=1 Tax=Bacillus spongiae TaxID=2683610 RepID=A0ABU8HJG9_9BACI
MLKVEQVLNQFIEQHDLVQEGDKIVVAVSGGPDSLMLLHYLFSNQEKWNINVMAISIDHMLRGEESHRDLLYVMDYCQKNNIPLLPKRIDVSKELKGSQGGVQEKARLLRYRAFEEAIVTYSATKLALGHHGDDQIETVLMSLTRGSSTQAIGIPLRRNFAEAEIIRPLLCLSKEDIVQYCEYHGLNPRIDPSNLKENYTRNRFRKRVLPFLQKENPHVHRHYQRFSQEMYEDDQFLLEITREKMSKIWDIQHGKVTLSITSFLEIPLPLQRRGIHLILNYLYKQKPGSLSAIHIYDVLSLIQKQHPSGTLHLPNNLFVTKSYGTCSFTISEGVEVLQPFHFQLTIGETTSIPSGSVFSISEEYQENHQVECIQLAQNEISFPLHIRTRQPGDRMKVKGLNGSKKVKDIFIDEKVPLDKRNTWPIVTDNDGVILWIPTLKVSELVKDSKDRLSVPTVFVYKKESSSRGHAKE